MADENTNGIKNPFGGGRLPIISSITDYGSNLKAGFMTGYTGSSHYVDKNGIERSRFNPTNGGFRGTIFNRKEYTADDGTIKSKFSPQMSVGGTLSAGYGAVGGALAGSAFGAISSNFLEGGNMIHGAVGGAVLGGAAIAAAPFTLGVTAKAAVSALQNSDKLFAGIGTGAAKVAGAIGMTVRGAVSNTARAAMIGNLEGKIAGNIVKDVLNPLDRHGKTLLNVAGKMIKKNPGNNADGIISDYSLSGFGKALVIGGSLVKGAKDAFNTYMNSKIGQRDGYISSVSPQIQFTDNAGATGDLVFALNNNRRG